MEKSKGTKTLTLRFSEDQFEGIINSYADKTGWTKQVAIKKLGVQRKKKNPLSQEQHVAKILQDRLISLYR